MSLVYSTMSEISLASSGLYNTLSTYHGRFWLSFLSVIVGCVNGYVSFTASGFRSCVRVCESCIRTPQTNDVLVLRTAT